MDHQAGKQESRTAELNLINTVSDADGYQHALDLLLGRVNYEQAVSIPYQAEHLKLARMRRLLEELGNPQDRYPIVHIAGTKGKGSAATMLAAIVSAAGKRVGSFTSPHLHRIEERIALDGRPCAPAELVALVEHVWPAVVSLDALAEKEGSSGPTYFEITTAMALVYFAWREVDLAVVEVGLGGRLDSTNVCTPLVSVITSISYDHVQQLGASLASIAREKAGIIKPGVPVVSGVMHSDAREVTRRRAAECHSRLRELGRDFGYHYRTPEKPGRSEDELESLQITRFDYCCRTSGVEYRDLALGMLGRHQAQNAAVALAALEELERRLWRLPESAVRAGLSLARMPARIEVVARRPTVVIDAAHNTASIQALVAVLGEYFPERSRTLIFGTTAGKDIAGMVDALGVHFGRFVLTRYQNSRRAVPPAELRDAFAVRTNRPCEVIEDPAEAWREVRSAALPEDLICVTGSFYLAAELRALFADEPHAAEAVDACIKAG